tara:strand:+ start:54 stop:461 length:408 start_codon:yes stop_codon:yes gene_type:complete
MATTIQEIEQIDAIECLESGAIQVKKGTYYEKTVSGETGLDEDGNEVEIPAVTTKSHVGNWRGVISLRDDARAAELLGDSANVATAHWANFPLPLEKPTEDNTVAEIKAYLDQEEISYSSGATKSELLALVPGDE